jgi:hypothetical protein
MVPLVPPVWMVPWVLRALRALRVPMVPLARPEFAARPVKREPLVCLDSLDQRARLVAKDPLALSY